MSDRLILADFCWTREQDPRRPLGHASILAELRRARDVDVASLVAPVNATQRSVGRLADEVLAQGTEQGAGSFDLAIGVYVWNERLVQSLCGELRRRDFGGRIVLGGPQISYAPPGVAARYPDADVFVRGYGEQALTALMVGGDRPISGVVRRGEPDLGLQAMCELSELASPFLEHLVVPSPGCFLRWETQRGCPFRCAFCQHKEAGARLRRRALDAGRVAAEIDLFCEARVGSIAVLDPIFNLGDQSVPILDRFAERGFQGRISLQCRAEAVTPDFLDAAQRLDVCLEFGLQTVHDAEGRAIRRRNNVAKVDQVLADVRRRNIDHEVTLIFGLPQQTAASFEASVDWCLQRSVPVIKAFPLLLLRGTELDAERDDWDLRTSGGEMGMVTRSSTFSEADWFRMAQVSEALAHTEGRHPLDIAGLRTIARDLQPDEQRWQPTAEGGR